MLYRMPHLSRNSSLIRANLSEHQERSSRKHRVERWVKFVCEETLFSGLWGDVVYSIGRIPLHIFSHQELHIHFNSTVALMQELRDLSHEEPGTPRFASTQVDLLCALS